MVGEQIQGDVVTAGDDERLVETRRRMQQLRAKEARVLKALSDRGGPVPRFLGFEEGWLLAADAGRRRLSQHLAAADADGARGLLGAAIESLTTIQTLGAEEALADVVIPFAQGQAVAAHLSGLPDAIGKRLELPAPERDVAAQAALLAAPGHAFVKWDARPANATVYEEVVLWHDFQHCNRRWPADDLVWLLCDETVPASARPAALLADAAKHHRGDDAWSPGAAFDYVATLGTAHVLTRLGGQLDAQDEGVVTTWEESLAQDWNGAPKAIAHLLRRGAAVSALSPLTSPLEPWFRELLDRHRGGRESAPG